MTRFSPATRFALSFVGMSVIVWSCPGNQPNQATTPADQLSVRISSTKPVFKPGEGISIRVEIWNDSAEQLFIGRTITGPDNAVTRLELTIYNNSHAFGPISESAADYIPSPNEPFANILARDWLLLPPRHFYGQIAYLSATDYPILQTAGRYEIKGRYMSEGFSSPRSDNPFANRRAEIDRLPFKPWSGSIDTNSIWIQIASRSR